MQFLPKVVYTVSREVLFLPALFYKSAIGHTDRFLVAPPPKMFAKRANQYFWFRMVDDPASHIFGVAKKYAHRIIPAEGDSSSAETVSLETEKEEEHT